MRTVGERLGNTRPLHVLLRQPAPVVAQYLDGRTIDDFVHGIYAVVGAKEIGLDLEERALLSLLRSWRIRQSRAAA